MLTAGCSSSMMTALRLGHAVSTALQRTLVLISIKRQRAFYVGEYNTKKLIDAEQAAWVIGGGKPGVMSKRAKWAFEKEADARAFIKVNGGNLATFDDAVKAAYEDMYADTKMIRERRKMKKMQMPAPAEQKR